MSGPLHFGVLVERRYLSQSQPSGLIEALDARGHSIRLIDPEATALRMDDDSWLEGLDLIVARGRSWGLLALLEWAGSRGVPTINRRTAISAVHNKADMSIALAKDRLPTPDTWFGTPERLADTIPSSAYPLIIKLIFGDNCRGLEVVDSAGALRALDWSDSVALAQSYHKTDGYDLKLYGIGDDVWAVRKPSPFNKRADDDPDAKKSGLAETTPELVDLGRRCGRLFGLDLFGVDCIETDRGVFVIEVNDYPNFTSVPDANERLADFCECRAAGESSK